MRYQNIVRDELASDLLEMMLVLSVATILCIRGFLALTGYPQLGGGNLHIAHMLWGGLGMFAAIALLLSFWNPAVRQLSAILGGIGFGFFIDELGKFITSDNDYFFQPTIALLYILFIMLFLVVRAMHSKPLSPMEISANQQIVAAISAGVGTTPASRIYMRVDRQLRNAYLWLVSRRAFAPVLSAAFLFVALAQVIAIVALVTGRSGGNTPSDRHIPLLEQLASGVSSAFIILGVLRLRRDRLSAYRWFQRSTLVTILVTQVFLFYYSELAAVGGLVLHFLVYVALRLLISREEELA